MALLHIFPLEVDPMAQEQLKITNKETESQNLCPSADIHQEDNWVIHKNKMNLLQLHTLIHSFTIQEMGECHT